MAVSNGRDTSGKQIIETATFIPDPSKTDKQNLKALEKFAMEFEGRVKSSKYLDGEKLTFQDFVSVWFDEYANHHLEAATLLISQNVDVKTVSSRLGHAQTSTTMDIYSHALKKLDEQAATVLDDLLTKKA